jgi:hypothetical protein
MRYTRLGFARAAAAQTSTEGFDTYRRLCRDALDSAARLHHALLLRAQRHNLLCQQFCRL